MEKTVKTLKRGELTSLIRTMNAGDVVRLPIAKYTSARNTIYTNLFAERAEGCKWSVRADLQNKQTIVTRVQ